MTATPSTETKAGRLLAALRDDILSGRLAPGDPAPEFTLPDADGTTVSLADYRGKRVVVYFYPAAGTPGCTKQACDFSDSLEALRAADTEVVGISPDHEPEVPHEPRIEHREQHADGLGIPVDGGRDDLLGEPGYRSGFLIILPQFLTAR